MAATTGPRLAFRRRGALGNDHAILEKPRAETSRSHCHRGHTAAFLVYCPPTSSTALLVAYIQSGVRKRRSAAAFSSRITGRTHGSCLARMPTAMLGGPLHPILTKTGPLQEQNRGPSPVDNQCSNRRMNLEVRGVL